MITPAEVREIFDYWPDSGLLTWKIKVCRAERGDVAGSKNRGYISIKYKQKKYPAHRLAYCHFYGEWPDQMIDHIDGDRSNNRIKNLRQATNQINQHNQTKLRTDNTSGYCGVAYVPRLNRYKAEIKVNKKEIYLGIYKDLESAINARKQAEEIYHPSKPTGSRT